MNPPRAKTNPDSPDMDVIGQLEKEVSTNPENFKANVDSPEPQKTDTLTRDQTNKIIQLYAEKNGVELKLALIGIAALAQGGGTNSSIPPFTRIVNGHPFELQTLRETVEFVTDKKGTVRQLAKTLRDTIYKISLSNNWLGPLAKTLLKDYPEKSFDQYELICAAEYHDDNMEPYMPVKVREALADRAKKLRAMKTAKPKSKSKKRKGK